MIVLTALLCLLLGVALGSLLTRALSPQAKERRELENRLREAEDAHRQYQSEVTEHFAQTANLVNQLAQAHRQVNHHLAAGAMTLANTDVGRKLLESAESGPRGPEGVTLPTNMPEPPKDYAPRVPGGVLSENYGFTEKVDIHSGGPKAVANDGAEPVENEDPTTKVG